MINITVTYKYQASDKQGFTFHGKGRSDFTAVSELTHNEIVERITKSLQTTHPGCEIYLDIEKVTITSLEKQSVLKNVLKSFFGFLKDIIVVGIIGYVLVKILA